MTQFVVPAPAVSSLGTQQAVEFKADATCVPVFCILVSYLTLVQKAAIVSSFILKDFVVPTPA